jgi:hypothetical protein
MQSTINVSSPEQVSSRILLVLLFIAGAQAATIKDFGAGGNGVSDDTTAIQRAIDATPPGAILTFPAGTYRLTSTLHLKSGVTYRGANSPVLRGYQATGPYGYVIADAGEANDIVICGIIFDGGGLAIAQVGGWTNNITITGNTFRNIVALGPDIESVHAGVFVDNVTNLSIVGNTFSRIIDGGAPTVPSEQGPMAVGIWIYHASHVTVADNSFDYMGQGISMSAIGDYVDLTDVRILRNRFTRTYRMAIEIRSGAPGHPLTGLVVDRNVGYNWLNAYPDSYGVSLAADSLNAQLTNNFWDASPANPGQTFGMCFEVDGNSTLVEGNSCVASNNPIGWGTTNANVVVAGVNAVIRNNTLCGGPQTIGTETHRATYRAYDNAFPPCGTVVAPPGAPIDTTPPSVPAGLTANPISSSQIALSWNASTDRAGVSGYTLYRNGSEVSTLSATSFQDFGLAPSTSYAYTLSAYDGTGNQSAQCAPVSATTPESTTIRNSAAPGPVSDYFDDASLNTGLWTFVNPVGDAMVWLNAGHAVITIPGGKSHDAWTFGNLSARLVQSVADTDFEVEVKFDVSAMAPHQIQGIMIEQDAQNYIRFDIYYDVSAPHLFAASIAGGVPTVRVDYPVISGAPVWLRMKRAGTTWTGSYSVNGVTFFPGVSFDHRLSVSKIGPFAGAVGGGDLPSPPFTALIDYWVNTANPSRER